MSLVTYLECLPGLALAWLLIIGVHYLGRIVSDPWPRARVRVVVRAPMPQPEPVEDPWSLHDHVLKYFLSPELRGEFANSPNFQDREAVQRVALTREPNNTLSSSEPAGSPSMTALQGAVSIDELRRGLEAPCQYQWLSE